MNATRVRHEDFRKLIQSHQLTCGQVAILVYRNIHHIRACHAGLRPVPQAMLRLLELELRVRERIAG